jgi:transcriptional regulator with XRE-family HTH domain
MPQERDLDRQVLGNRLKKAREYRELSQDEVDRILSVPRTAISLMEAGQRKVEAIELKKLAEIYEQPISFFTGEPDTVAAPIPEAVKHLARTAAKLSDRDREELLRFAQFPANSASSRRSLNKCPAATPFWKVPKRQPESMISSRSVRLWRPRAALSMSFKVSWRSTLHCYFGLSMACLVPACRDHIPAS